MRRLAAFLVIASASFAQPWAGIISSSRAIDWSKAGLPATFPDGETTPNPWTPPTRTQCGSTLTPLGAGADDTTRIMNALSACTAGHYVLLGPGTFTINGAIRMTPGYNNGVTNISLKGSGAQSTKLNIGSSGAIYIGAAGGGGSCYLTASSAFAAGSTTVICSGSAPPVNQPVFLSQCDTGRSGASCTTGTDADNGGIWQCGEQTICANQPAAGSHIHEQQTVLVTAVSGDCTVGCNVTFTPGIYMPDFAYASTPRLTWFDAYWTSIGTGFEDMTVDFSAGTTSNNGAFSFEQAYASWVRGVRFIGSNASACCAISMGSLGNSLFANNYLFTSNPITQAGAGLSTAWGSSSATLMLNNIWHSGGGINHIEGAGRNSGNVLAYNYSRDSVNFQVYNGDAEHSGSPNFILREGNQFGFANDDATWGTHNFDTFFRNYYSCADAPYAGLAAPKGIVIDNWARFANVVGNALGSASCTNYESGSNSIFVFGANDTKAKTTSMRWGNYDTVNGAVRWVNAEVPSSLASPNAAYSNPVPGTQVLPASFFMDTTNGASGISWWKVCTSWSSFPTSCLSTKTPPLPAIGPDVTGGSNINGYAHDIPAAAAWKNLPIDTAYQQSFTITGSSWSNGIETLTVSSLPSGTGHIMGGFQLSGVNASCLPGSGVSYTGRPDGEILMTGSSATTISYALPSNPGVACTGTFKFPDIRQFDQRVYQVGIAAPKSGRTTQVKLTIR